MQKLLSFFQQKFQCIWLESCKTLNELTSERTREANNALNNRALADKNLNNNKQNKAKKKKRNRIKQKKQQRNNTQNEKGRYLLSVC